MDYSTAYFNLNGPLPFIGLYLIYYGNGFFSKTFWTINFFYFLG